MKNLTLKNFFILWISQLVSSLGSSMTSFAITVWAYAETNSALVLSISGAAIMLPRMIGGIFVGPLVDKINKKAVLIVSDVGAGLCSILLFLLLWNGALQIWHIYCLNILNSLFACFQSPASDVVISTIVTKEHYTKASAMQSLSSGTVQVLSPAFAVVLLEATGMAGVIIFDIFTMAFSCMVLLLFIRIPETMQSGRKHLGFQNYFAEFTKGFHLLLSKKLLMSMLLFFVFINFVAGMTYCNLLSPLILARTQHNLSVLALVNGALGLGGITGAIITTIVPSPKRKTKAVFLCAALSFLLGDILIAIGKTPAIWIIAAFLSSVFLPLLNASESFLWRIGIPIKYQGRAFSFKYAFQSGAIPFGMLIGGISAEYYFEPYMKCTSNLFSPIVGNTSGSGMALMFLLTGSLGMIISVIGLYCPLFVRLEDELL